MTDTRQLVFRDHDTLGGIAPTIDGHSMVDSGVLTGEAVESGYINAGRVTLGPGVLPPVVIQAVRHNDTLVLAITCRGDPSFDNPDGLVIALRQNGGAAAGPQRRIDVFPVWGDPPAGVPDPDDLGTGYGAANPDGMNPGTHLVEAADFPDFDVRTNKPPHIGANFYQRGGDSGPWTQFTPAMANDPAKYHVRVRSWKPAVAAESPEECAWGIEVRFPLGTAGGTADWINLADDFGIFVDVIRANRAVEDGDLVYQTTQFIFPMGAPPLTGAIDTSTDIPAASFGHGLKGPAVSQGIGVRIKNGAYGIGRRAAGSAAGSPLSNGISKTVDNEIVAMLENTGPAANGIKAEVRMWNYGLPPATFDLWDVPAGCAQPSPEVDLDPGTTMAPEQGETINSWPAILVGAEYPAGGHQCMWIQLDATSPVVFSQSSVRRNMNFVNLSSVSHDITISGEGYPEPEDGGPEHDFLLFSRCRKIVVKELVEKQDIDPLTRDLVIGALQAGAGEANAANVDNAMLTTGRSARGRTTEWKNTVVYLWITEGFRRTDKFLTVNGIKTRILDNSPGDFGFIARHEGVDDNMNWAFAAQGTRLFRHAPGTVGIKVPHKGKVVIGVRLAAGREEKSGDQSDLPLAPGIKRGSGDSTDGKGGKGGNCLGTLVGIGVTLGAIVAAFQF